MNTTPKILKFDKDRYEMMDKMENLARLESVGRGNLFFETTTTPEIDGMGTVTISCRKERDNITHDEFTMEISNRMINRYNLNEIPRMMITFIPFGFLNHIADGLPPLAEWARERFED